MTINNDFSNKTQEHDLGVENGDTYEKALYGFVPGEPVVKAAVRKALADKTIWCALDHDSFKDGCVREERRTGRGQYVLEAVLEFLVEDQGYPLREAMDALVLEAVRVACNADKKRSPKC